MVWAIRFFQDHRGETKDVLDLFDLPSNEQSKALAAAALKKSMRVHYFQTNGKVCDISNLDPSSASLAEAGWGGLTDFSGRAGELVARVSSREGQPDLPAFQAK
jgi:hypothetical protein